MNKVKWDGFKNPQSCNLKKIEIINLDALKVYGSTKVDRRTSFII